MDHGSFIEKQLARMMPGIHPGYVRDEREEFRHISFRAQYDTKKITHSAINLRKYYKVDIVRDPFVRSIIKPDDIEYFPDVKPVILGLNHELSEKGIDIEFGIFSSKKGNKVELGIDGKISSELVRPEVIDGVGEVCKSILKWYTNIGYERVKSLVRRSRLNLPYMSLDEEFMMGQQIQEQIDVGAHSIEEILNELDILK